MRIETPNENTPDSDGEKDATSEELLRGTIRRITFSNAENAYCVLLVSVPQHQGDITIVGDLLSPRVGASISARGRFIQHKKFGRQFQAANITEVEPTGADGVRNFIGSGLIKGIGPKTAEKIVERFGDEALNVIIESPHKVSKVPGISLKKAELMSKTLREQKANEQAIQFLLEHNLTSRLAHRIVSRFGTKTVELLKQNPYILSEKIRGIGFHTADSIALRLGMSEDASVRREAALLHSLSRARDDGHCFLPERILLERTAELLRSTYSLNEALETCLASGKIERDGESSYLPTMLNHEIYCARFIADALSKQRMLEQTDAIETAANKAEAALGISLSPQQREAVGMAQSQRVSILTGGPGCGKTTATRAILNGLLEQGKVVALAAPTGRAAQRMASVCEHPASTIHRLLRYDPFSNRFQFNEDAPIEIEEKLIDALIVDEASMLDLELMKALLSALPDGAQLILVGDKDQLPSVGPGTVFADLVSSPHVPTTTLTQLFRRESHSRINEVAHAFNAGIVPEIPEPDGQTKSDVYFIARGEADDCARLVESLFERQVTEKFGIPRNDIFVLTPSNRGALGTLQLNTQLQTRVNPEGESIEIGDSLLRVGDRVVQRVNNYTIDDFGVFNGDMGVIHSVDTKTRSAVIELWDGRLLEYDQRLLQQISLAYASTVHRAQGSEARCVLLCLHESHFPLLERQLVYTAITRAKEILIIVGSKRALAMSAKKHSAKLRYSKLGERLEQLFNVV